MSMTAREQHREDLGEVLVDAVKDNKEATTHLAVNGRDDFLQRSSCSL